MCYNVEMTVHLREDAGTDSLALPAPSAFPLSDLPDDARLQLRGTFPHYYVFNGACGCGSIEGPTKGPGRLVPVRFVSEYLAVFSLESIELIWWWGNDLDKPLDPPRRPVHWRDFVNLNEKSDLESGVAYVILGKPEPRRQV